MTQLKSFGHAVCQLSRINHALGWVSIDAVLGCMARFMNGARLTAPIENCVNGKPPQV